MFWWSPLFIIVTSFTNSVFGYDRARTSTSNVKSCLIITCTCI